MSETLTINQDQYDGQTPDGLLVQCHYIAEGTEVEFTIDPLGSGTWHLYAFSNRESELNLNITSDEIDDLWNLNQWQHIAVSVAEDGLTKFYSDGQFLGSFNGESPENITRDYHVIGGNRLWMDQFSPDDLDGLKLWLDASDGSTLFQDFNGTEFASSGEQIGRWTDKSGHGHDGIIFDEGAERTPLYQTDAFQQKTPAIVFDGSNDLMIIQDSRIAFDAWSELTLITVHDRTNGNGWVSHMSKGHRDDSTFGWEVLLRNPGNGAANFIIKGTNGNEWTDMWNNDHWAPAMLYLSFGNGGRLCRLNGSQIAYQSDGGTIASASSVPVSIGGKLRSSGTSAAQYAGIMFSEVIIIEGAPDSLVMEKIEGYLAHKWDLENKLPDIHSFKNAPPITPPPDFQLFDGMVDDLRIYDRALSAGEIGQIHAGDLSENQNIGGQAPRLVLFWGDEDGGTNPEVNASSSLAWDTKVELGTKDIGDFSHPLTGLEFGKTYYFRFLAENDAGSVWSPNSSSFSSGSFSLAADTWQDANLLLWLDAADINGDGNLDNEPFAGTVDIWRDKSGGNRHATHGQGPDLIYGALNNRSVLGFNGSSNYLRVPDYDDQNSRDLDIGLEGTLLLVIKSESTDPGSYLLSKGWGETTGWSFFSNNQNLPTLGLRGTSAQDESTILSGWANDFDIFTFRKSDIRRLLRINANLNFDLLDSGSVVSSEE